MFGVFRVKNHDFTPKKILFFPILGGARAGCAPPPPSPGSTPAASEYNYKTICNLVINNDIYFFQNLNITLK